MLHCLVLPGAEGNFGNWFTATDAAVAVCAFAAPPVGDAGSISLKTNGSSNNVLAIPVVLG